MTVRNGTTAAGGGAIRDQGALGLNAVDLVHNLGNLNNTGAQGGALAILGAPASATLTNVGITDNQALGGAGIFLQLGSLNATNVTIVGNHAASSGFGGGLLSDRASVTVTLNTVTIARNTAAEGGGIALNGGVLALSNTIIASNDATFSPNCDLRNDGLVTSTMTSQGYNLVFPGNGCGLSPGTNDLVNPDRRSGRSATTAVACSRRRCSPAALPSTPPTQPRPVAAAGLRHHRRPWRGPPGRRQPERECSLRRRGLRGNVVRRQRPGRRRRRRAR